MSKFNPGDRVHWQYTHQNGRSRFERVKVGIVVGYVRVRDYTRYPAPWVDGDKVKVRFETNKTISTVLESELRAAV